MKTKFNEFNKDVIEYNGKEYIITDKLPEVGDLYINYEGYKRGLMFPKQLPLLIGTVMEIVGDQIYANEFKSDILKNCRKLDENL